MISEYRQAVDAALGVMTPGNHEFVLAIAGFPDEIRGFGYVKNRSIQRARALLADLQAKLAAATDDPLGTQADAETPQEERI